MWMARETWYCHNSFCTILKIVIICRTTAVKLAVRRDECMISGSSAAIHIKNRSALWTNIEMRNYGQRKGSWIVLGTPNPNMSGSDWKSARQAGFVSMTEWSYRGWKSCRRISNTTSNEPIANVIATRNSVVNIFVVHSQDVNFVIGGPEGWVVVHYIWSMFHSEGVWMAHNFRDCNAVIQVWHGIASYSSKSGRSGLIDGRMILFYGNPFRCFT